MTFDKLYRGGLTLMTALLLSSCSSDDIAGEENIQPENPAKEGVELTFNLSIGNGGTRSMESTDVDGESYDQLHNYWGEGEQVTMRLKHGTKVTMFGAKVKSISSDRRTATVSTTLPEGTAKGDELMVIYPYIGTTGTHTFDYTQQDGTLENVSKLDLRAGTALLQRVSGGSATLSGGVVTLSSPAIFNVSDDYDDIKQFGSAYFGIKCTDENGRAIRVKKLALSKLPDANNPANSAKTWVRTTSINLKNEYPDGTNERITSISGQDTIYVTPERATTDRLYVAIPSPNAGLTVTFTVLASNGEIYYVDKIIPATANNYYPVTLQMKKLQDDYVTDENSGYVDLGLGVYWSTCYLGSLSPYLPGDKYAWGATQPGTSSKFYKDITKYNAENPKLQPEDDAAYQQLGSRWRLPTYKECQDLRDSCIWVPKTIKRRNGVEVKGALGTSKINGKQIFFPLIPINSTQLQSKFWTSAAYTTDGGETSYAFSFGYSGTSLGYGFDSRSSGYSGGDTHSDAPRSARYFIRPVRVKSTEY